MIYMGCDPGKTGAIATLSRDGKLITISDYNFVDNILDVRGVVSILDAVKDYHSDKNIICCLEKSQAMPGQGVTGMFNYGKFYGLLYAALLLGDVKIIEISPQKWKKEFNLNSNKKLGIIKTKEDSVLKAIELYPGREDSLRRPKKNGKEGFINNDGRAEALLMAEYCRRTHGT